MTTTENTPRKRLMVPAMDRPFALVTGELDGLKFYGPTDLDDTPDGFRAAREARLDHEQQPWQLIELHDLGHLDAIDGDNGIPDSPIEVKRAEFLALATAARELLAEAERLADQANENDLPGREDLTDDLHDQANGTREQGYELMEQAFALAEELLA